MIGCKHNPDVPCEECVKALGTGEAIYIDTNLKPEVGESLADFQKRVEAEHKGLSAEVVEPSVADMKAAIKDSATPEPVRRFLREKLYGKGGGGRKSIQQETLRQRAATLQDNLGRRTFTALRAQAGTLPPRVRPPEMSGRQWKRCKRLLRQAAKVVKSAV